MNNSTMGKKKNQLIFLFQFKAYESYLTLQSLKKIPFEFLTAERYHLMHPALSF